MIELIKGDCNKEMCNIKSDSIDLIITSPPYEDFHGAGYSAESKDILFLKLYNEFLDDVFNNYYRILKETGQIFFNIKSKTFKKSLNTPHWIEHLQSFKLFKLKSFIIWKYAGSFDSTKARFHLDYEIIYHLSKGDNIYLNQDCGIHDSLSSVWYVPHNILKKDRIHPTQMPEALVERILTICSKENDIILDNFMGSGTTGVVCKKNNLDFIGIELNENHFIKATERIENIKTQQDLFNL
tara:strand:- start:893 stop:1612 length:720 start_codon:yes stop_codon:yes gene_type:complete